MSCSWAIGGTPMGTICPARLISYDASGVRERFDCASRWAGLPRTRRNGLSCIAGKNAIVPMAFFPDRELEVSPARQPSGADHGILRLVVRPQERRLRRQFQERLCLCGEAVDQCPWRPAASASAGSDPSASFEFGAARRSRQASRNALATTAKQIQRQSDTLTKSNGRAVDAAAVETCQT